LLSREATMLLQAPRGSVIAVVAGAASGTKHIWGLYRLPLPGHADCGPQWIASQKLYRAPGWPIKRAG
jgi:hypothetical protein